MKTAVSTRFLCALSYARKKLSNFSAQVPGKWTRALFLVPALLIPVAVMEFGIAVNSSSSLANIISALKAPLSLITDGSPGGRAPGALLSTKPNFGPHERVLSESRERDNSPGSDTPVSSVPSAEPASGVTPDNGTLPDDQTSGSPFNTPFANGMNPGGGFDYGNPGFSNFGFGNTAVPQGQITSAASAPPAVGTIVPESPVFDAASVVSALPPPPEDQPIFPPSDTPVENGIVPPDDVPALPPTGVPVLTTPIVASVSEPSTWSLMLFGLLVMGTTARRRMRKQNDLVGAQ